jgi:hypothetical protein
MSDDPVQKAKAGLGEAWKAAKTAAGGVKKEIEKAGIAKTIDDAGREIARAATSVASHLGAELEELGREIRLKAEGADAATAGEPGADAAGATQAGGKTPPAEPPAGSDRPAGGVRIASD